MYLPPVTLAQFLAYVPEQAETHTPSPIINALAQTLCTTPLIEAKEVAAHLAVDVRKLSGAIEIEMGMRLIDAIHQFRLHQIQQYLQAHPEARLEDVAHAFGYASDVTLWRLFQRKLGLTAKGRKSQAGPERFNLMVREIRNRR